MKTEVAASSERALQEATAIGSSVKAPQARRAPSPVPPRAPPEARSARPEVRSAHPEARSVPPEAPSVPPGTG